MKTAKIIVSLLYTLLILFLASAVIQAIYYNTTDIVLNGQAETAFSFDKLLDGTNPLMGSFALLAIGFAVLNGVSVFSKRRHPVLSILLMGWVVLNLLVFFLIPSLEYAVSLHAVCPCLIESDIFTAGNLLATCSIALEAVYLIDLMRKKGRDGAK